MLSAASVATADPEPTSAQISPVETAQTIATEPEPQALAAPPSAYEDALSKATAASESLPTAETAADWERIAAQWQSAIAPTAIAQNPSHSSATDRDGDGTISIQEVRLHYLDYSTN